MESTTIPIIPPKLVTETERAITNGIFVREVKILDQFGSEFDSLIKEYKTPRSICGYVVSGIAPYAAKTFKAEMDHKNINEILTDLSKDSKLVCSLVKTPISSIQNQRKEYVENYKSEFKTERDQEGYITDWVANYEISDALRAKGLELDNVFFLRYVAWDFPDLASEAKNEEARRIEEERPFEGQKMFVEVFWPERELKTIEDFVAERRDIKIYNEGRPMVFVADLRGHFVTFVALKIQEIKGMVQEGLLLLDSTKGSYLSSINGKECACKIGEMAFPDVYKSNSKGS